MTSQVTDTRRDAEVDPRRRKALALLYAALAMVIVDCSIVLVVLRRSARTWRSRPGISSGS